MFLFIFMNIETVTAEFSEDLSKRIRTPRQNRFLATDLNEGLLDRVKLLFCAKANNNRVADALDSARTRIIDNGRGMLSQLYNPGAIDEFTLEYKRLVDKYNKDVEIYGKFGIAAEQIDFGTQIEPQRQLHLNYTPMNDADREKLEKGLRDVASLFSK